MVRVSLFVLLAAMAAGSPALADGKSSQLGLNWNAGANTIVIVLPPPVPDDGARDQPRRPNAQSLGIGQDYVRCSNGICTNY